MEKKKIHFTHKCVLLVVGSTHPATNHNVEANVLTLIVRNDDAANVIRIEIKAVVARDGYPNLELPRKIPVTI